MEKDDIEELGEHLTQIATNTLVNAERNPSKEVAREEMASRLGYLAKAAARNEGTLAVSGMLYMILVALSVNRDSELLVVMTAYAEEHAAQNNAKKAHNDAPLGL